MAIKDDVKNMTAEEMSAALKARTLKPKTDEDFDFLSKIGATAPDSEERNALYAETTDTVEGGDVKEASNVVEFPSSEAKEAPIEDATKLFDGDDFGGFASAKELKEAYIKTRTDYDEMNRKHRDTNGRLGNELKSYKDKVSRFESGVKPETIDNSEVTRPEIPIPPEVPVPTDFEDGTFDEGYIAATKQYKSDMAEYRNNTSKFNDENERYLNHKAKTIASSELEQFRPMKESAEKLQRDTVVSEAWGGLWTKVGEIQRDYGLNTSMPISTINDHVAVVTNPEKHTPDEVEASDRFIKSLPQKDMEAFNKVAPLVNDYFVFDDGLPKTTKYKSFRAYLIDNDLEDSFIPASGRATDPKRLETEALARQQQKLNTSAQTLTGSSAFSDGGSLSPDNLSRSELENKFHELSKLVKRRPMDKELREEFDTVCTKLGL